MPIPSNFTLQAVILDMDGVITDTARLHAKAWKQMFDSFLEKKEGVDYMPLDIEKDYKRNIDGISRLDGVRSFVKSRDIHLPEGNPEDGSERDTVYGLAKRKNDILLLLLEKEGVSVFEDTLDMLKFWKKKGVKLAVISASRNCRYILESAGILDWFEVRVDGESVEKEHLPGKPDPAIFLRAQERLASDLDQTLVIEDAIAGVEAAKNGGFPIVVGVARKGKSGDLIRAGADIVVHKLTEIDLKIQETIGLDIPENLPHALESMEEVFKKLMKKSPVLFFDYDGTLSPIVDDPDDAKLSDEGKTILKKLSKLLPLAVISGRGLDDLKGNIGIRDLIYAGSHGFEISGPGGLDKQHEGGIDILPELDKAETQLNKRLDMVSGCVVERKKYAIAVHYRNVDVKKVSEIKNAVEEIVKQRDKLKIGKGKKILELKPDFNWHKGHALNWLLEKLELKTNRYYPIFFGDDITDEDAFEMIQSSGLGILVGTHGQKTHAHMRLEDTGEVYLFLEELIEWLESGARNS
ncbi:MAG: trehalose-phosphatase [Cyclobacterium sp.]|uniref:trehalose-phosphatase n=1 Tax=unclassified Cyclobacterium TaxID=2615055 RepID=UPI0013D6221A|nr:trehalose-phosphatase [Cyclobacterium sp. SYSU L10401]